MIKHWATVDYVPSTDHVLNEFMFMTDDCWTPRPGGYVLDKCKWQTDIYSELMEETVCPIIGIIWGPSDLDMEGSAIPADMNKCMRQTAPISDTITIPYGIDWWNGKIDKLQARLKTIRHYLRKWCFKRLNRNLPDLDSNVMKYSWDDLKDARKTFKKACRKAKRRHWQRTVSEIHSTVVTANLNKRLNRENNAEIGLFTKPNGQRCTTEETMDMLRDKHFPGNSTDEPPPTQPLATRVDITSPEAAFITPERVKWCIKSFKPRSGAGHDGLRPACFQHLGPKALQRLTNLFKASYLLGIQPKHFKLVRVIFIP